VDRQEAIDFLLEHYENPRNHGPLADADVVMPGGHPDCGDRVTLYLKLDPAGQRIERLTFEGEGCTLSQAAASILTELVVDMPLVQAAVLDGNAMIDRLGRDVVQSRPRCATLALNTLKAAIAQYRKAKV
jgi:nitrogen fixation NifU-like protein